MPLSAVSPGPYPPIADYALLSDCFSAALVSRCGSIDWACLRRFDAGSTFGRLLDWEEGGHFSIRPVDDAASERRYIGDSLVLQTEFRTAGGLMRVTDCFAMRRRGGKEPRHELVRVIDGLEGAVEVDVVLRPRFDYGETRPWLRRHDEDSWSACGGDDAISIGSTVPLELDNDDFSLAGRVTVRDGTRLAVVVVATAPHALDPDAAHAPAAGKLLAETETWWERWSQRSTIAGRWSKERRRSAVVLKGLTCAPTGAIIAAATTSLPETIGGTRNWDYRYSWVRDSTLTLEALEAAGHPEVAEGFRRFIMRSAAGHADELQIMYGIHGEHRLLEFELGMAGYRGSRPVRVGNAAAGQLQLDVYGYLLDAIHDWQAHDGGVSDDEWRFLHQLVNRAADNWEVPDAGIWEMRGEPLHHVYSKVQLWVALDRGISFVEEHGRAGEDLERWRTARDAIRTAVDERGVDPDGGHFVQHFGGRSMDASLLRLSSLGFVDPDDPRMLATVQAVRDQLGLDPPCLVARYHVEEGDDGVSDDPEGAFLACSFWLVEALVRQGDIDEAATIYEQLLTFGNDLDLHAEEYDPATGEMLGNFPQAFTHVGIIRAGHMLAEALGERPGR